MIKQILEGLSDLTETAVKVRPDILMLKFTVVNAFIVCGRESWFLVDTGLESSYDFILETAEQLDGKPVHILLTHGHFDHTGSVRRLAETWDVPVYAHPLETPYLTGERSYPEGRPDADKGLVAKMSAHFPERPIDVGRRLSELPRDGFVPAFPEWRWIATPGHTPGHVSLFRRKDGILIVGDAFAGTKQESLLSVLTQEESVKGPPAYFTQDWDSAKQSVQKLWDLKPNLALFSHGNPKEGEDLSERLGYLASHFEEVARPGSKH
jgi:glyoxylase-like metal-dependent hydrolase (beta-lactamase superfamily II)